MLISLAKEKFIMAKKKIRMGVVGLGARGFFAGEMYPGMIHILAVFDDVELVWACDEYQDRVDTAVAYMKEHNNIEMKGTTDYMDIVNDPTIDAVAIFCAWEMHVPIAVAAMKAGKAVALEVGGAYSVEDCWRLVRTQEETGAYFMMLENCCYGREELFTLDMVKKGIFGDIVHCTGGYLHDLRGEISEGEEKRHYRLRNYLSRNCDNYPTHQLGPICKVLDVNRGNRMVSLVSMASKSMGLNEYNKTLHGEDHKLAKAQFKQGDIVTTIIKCAGGQTITLTLDTSLPRPNYSRDYSVRGTKGAFVESTKSVVFDSSPDYPDGIKHTTGNSKELIEKYKHPIWKEYDDSGNTAGHGGMDWHVLRAFVEGYLEGHEPPIDVYDAAAWMCISALTETSIAQGGHPVEIPDFTGGKWVKVKEKPEWKYSI